MVGLAGGVGEAGVARPKSDANGLDNRGPAPPDGAGCVCLALGRGGKGGPFGLGRAGKVKLAVCPWTAKDGYEGPSREFSRWDSVGILCVADKGRGSGESDANAEPRVAGVRRAWNGFDEGDSVDRKVNTLLGDITHQSSEQYVIFISTLLGTR